MHPAPRANPATNSAILLGGLWPLLSAPACPADLNIATAATAKTIAAAGARPVLLNRIRAAVLPAARDKKKSFRPDLWVSSVTKRTSSKSRSQARFSLRKRCVLKTAIGLTAQRRPATRPHLNAGAKMCLANKNTRAAPEACKKACKPSKHCQSERAKRRPKDKNASAARPGSTGPSSISAWASAWLSLPAAAPPLSDPPP